MKYKIGQEITTFMNVDKEVIRLYFSVWFVDILLFIASVLVG